MARSRRNRPDRNPKPAEKAEKNHKPKPDPKPAPAKKARGKAADEPLQFHPICLRIPDHTPQEQANITESVKANGLIEPIVLLDGMILDGRGRYRACLEAKVSPRFVDWWSLPESTTMTPDEYVLAKNFDRRNLNDAGCKFVFTSYLRDEPSKPDSWFVKHLHLAPATVKKLRAELDATGEVPDPGYRTTADGAVRPTSHAKAKEGDKRKKEPEKKDDYPAAPPDAGDAWEPGADEAADLAAADAHKAEFTDSGDRVPAHLADVFGDPFYKDATEVMRRWARHVRSRPDTYVRLVHNKAFLEHLKNAVKALEFSSPYCVCQNCDGSGTTGNGGCDECLTTGWVSQGEAEAKEFTE